MRICWNITVFKIHCINVKTTPMILFIEYTLKRMNVKLYRVIFSDWIPKIWFFSAMREIRCWKRLYFPEQQSLFLPVKRISGSLISHSLIATIVIERRVFLTSPLGPLPILYRFCHEKWKQSSWFSRKNDFALQKMSCFPDWHGDGRWKETRSDIKCLKIEMVGYLRVFSPGQQAVLLSLSTLSAVITQARAWQYHASEQLTRSCLRRISLLHKGWNYRSSFAFFSSSLLKLWSFG